MRSQPLNFGDVLDGMRSHGGRYYREGRNGVRVDGVGSMYVSLVEPDEPLLPHLVLVTPKGTQVPWLATSTDLLAEDWRRIL